MAAGARRPGAWEWRPVSSDEDSGGTADVITPDEFFRADIRVGQVVRAEEFPQARNPAYKLWIDFGEDLGTRTSSAQLTALYRAADLTGTLVLAVVNFPPRRVAGFKSEVLVLGVPADGKAVALVRPDRAIPPGTRVF